MCERWHNPKAAVCGKHVNYRDANSNISKYTSPDPDCYPNADAHSDYGSSADTGTASTGRRVQGGSAEQSLGI